MKLLFNEKTGMVGCHMPYLVIRLIDKNDNLILSEDGCITEANLTGENLFLVRKEVDYQVLNLHDFTVDFSHKSGSPIVASCGELCINALGEVFYYDDGYLRLFNTPRSVVFTCALKMDDNFYILGTEEGDIVYLNPGNNFIRMASGLGRHGIFCISKAGKKIFVFCGDGSVYLRDSLSPQVFHKIDTLPYPPKHVRVSHSGKIYLVSSQGIYKRNHEGELTLEYEGYSDIRFYSNQNKAILLKGEVIEFHAGSF